MIEDVYGARRVEQVLDATWGHLRPDPGRHDGHVIAACSEYDGGQRLLVAANFDGVPDSPWLYGSMYELIENADMAEGSVYRFTGALVVTGHRCRFEGEWTQMGESAK